jgi:prevent-host-death family protein
MVKVSIKEAKDRLSELGRLVEDGEQVVITRNGEPKFELVLHESQGGTNWEAGKAYLKSLGVDKLVEWVSPDFDEPLPEDFLITPLPPEFDKSKAPRKKTVKKK